jgi:hypothetical protein
MPAKKSSSRSRSRSPKARKDKKAPSDYIQFVMKAADLFEKETGKEANRFELVKALKDTKAWSHTTDSKKGSGDIEKFRKAIPKYKSKIVKN